MPARRSPLTTTRSPIRVDGQALRSDSAAPRLGEHDEQVRRELADDAQRLAVSPVTRRRRSGSACPHLGARARLRQPGCAAPIAIASSPAVGVAVDARSLQAFADAPLAEVTVGYDLVVLDHPHIPLAAEAGLLAGPGRSRPRSRADGPGPPLGRPLARQLRPRRPPVGSRSRRRGPGRGVPA